jgi:hypothetical protein
MEITELCAAIPGSITETGILTEKRSVMLCEDGALQLMEAFPSGIYAAYAVVVFSQSLSRSD